MPTKRHRHPFLLIPILALLAVILWKGVLPGETAYSGMLITGSLLLLAGLWSSYLTLRMRVPVERQPGDDETLFEYRAGYRRAVWRGVLGLIGLVIIIQAVQMNAGTVSGLSVVAAGIPAVLGGFLVGLLLVPDRR